MPSEEEKEAVREQMAAMQKSLEKALDHYLFEEREDELAVLAKAEAEMIQSLKDTLGELTDEEQASIDAECDRQLDAELRRNVFAKARQMGRTETTTAILRSMSESDLRSKREVLRRQKMLDARRRERFIANADGSCTLKDCPIHGKKNPE